MTHSGTVTLLFSDLVNSTELLSRTGYESAHRIFEAYKTRVGNVYLSVTKS